jgi:hypothetical protein
MYVSQVKGSKMIALKPQMLLMVIERQKTATLTDLLD